MRNFRPDVKQWKRVKCEKALKDAQFQLLFTLTDWKGFFLAKMLKNHLFEVHSTDAF